MPLPAGWIESIKGSNENYSYENAIFEAEREFIGPWSDRFIFLKTTIFPTSINNNGIVSYLPPAQYPDLPQAYAYTASIRPYATPGYPVCTGIDNSIVWEKCKILVKYRTPEFDPEPGGGGGGGSSNPVFITEQFDTSLSGLDVPISHSTSTTSDVEGEFQQDHRANLIIPNINYRLTIHFLPESIFTTKAAVYESLLGKVNTTALITPSGPKASNPGTLRYDGPSGIRRYDIGGLRTWEISHVFVFNRYGWNNQINLENGKFEEVHIKGNPNQLLFEEADLNQIFN